MVRCQELQQRVRTLATPGCRVPLGWRHNDDGMPVVRAGPPDLVQQSQLKGAGAVGIGQAHGAPACALRVQGVMSAREHDDGVGTDQHAPLPTYPDSSHLYAASMIIWLCSRDELAQVPGSSRLELLAGR